METDESLKDADEYKKQGNPKDMIKSSDPLTQLSVPDLLTLLDCQISGHKHHRLWACGEGHHAKT